MPDLNYTLDNLEARAEAAKLANADYLNRLAEQYKQRAERRQKLGIPVIAFCGHGRSGKDLSAEYLSFLKPQVVYPNSLSRVVLPLIAHMSGDTAEHAWEHRHNVREFWIEACHKIRARDLTLLLRMSLGIGDVVAGIRGLFEIDSVRQQKTADYIVWVRNDRVEKDKTVEYGEEDCDFTILNNGSRMELFARLRKFVSLLQQGYFKGDE